VYGRTREEALMRLSRALDEYIIDGIDTTLSLHKKLVTSQDIIDGNYDVHWLERTLNI
jgi:acetyl-CoA carboxylase biotin carboxylase subunit